MSENQQMDVFDPFFTTFCIPVVVENKQNTGRMVSDGTSVAQRKAPAAIYPPLCSCGCARSAFTFCRLATSLHSLPVPVVLQLRSDQMQMEPFCLTS